MSKEIVLKKGVNEEGKSNERLRKYWLESGENVVAECKDINEKAEEARWDFEIMAKQYLCSY